MSLPTYDITSGYADYFERHRLFDALPTIGYAPVKMAPAERLLLWSLAYSTRPRSYLEIGSLEGGSALIVASALDTLGASGRLALIEPSPRIAPAVWTRLAPRTTLVRGFSPAAIPEAVASLGGPVELAFVDGDHGFAGALADGEGLLPYLADGAYVLFHDCHLPAVAGAIDDLLARHPTRWVDAGIVTREVTRERTAEGGEITWGGLRLLHHRSATLSRDEIGS